MNGENPCAIESAFTNSLQFRKSGINIFGAVVLPAPFGHAII
jgi:hypothetical protein